MMAQIFFAGDVMGAAGRRALRLALARLRQDEPVDAVVVNGENAAGGAGITATIAQEFCAWGVDVITTGNHIWDRREALTFIEAEPRLLRPYNAPPGTPGAGWVVVETRAGWRLGVLNLMGRLFMHPMYDCPFRAADAALAQKPAECDVVVVDMHAEATSEKMAMGWYLAGRVSGVMGSHTHVPTADERVLPGGTAYQSDAGMCGCYDSVIGVDKDASIRRFITALPGHAETVDGVASCCGLLMTVDTDNGRCSAVRRVRYDFPQALP
ncbi:MAG: TIGR00282 family metallophosphoesterase [Acidithiobacillus sp.]